jgi:7-carboxy-7-deazaguanine synthase
MKTLEELLDEAAQSGLEHVVLTGGEPMIFEPIEELTYRLADRGHVITIETAGTVDRPVVCHLMSLSPKLAHSAPDPAEHPGWSRRHEETRSDLAPCASLMKRHPFQLKFVVNPESGLDDVAEIEAILSRLPKTEPAKVFLMAEGTRPSDLHRRERMLVDVCMSRGWRLIPRFHIDLFGDTRGT